MGTRLVVSLLFVSSIFLLNVVFVYWTVGSQRCPVCSSSAYDANKCELFLSLVGFELADVFQLLLWTLSVEYCETSIVRHS